MIKKIKTYFKKIIKPKAIVKVYSHPRSGTHFLEAFLAENFYKKKDLSVDKVTWGHWSNRQVREEGNPYGKLFGNHYLANKNKNDLPKLYILRDPRAVAYSVWKTPNFLHKDLENLTFKEFLRTPIDWSGTPSIKAEPILTILEHWKLHTDSWYKLSEQNGNILIITYEDLIKEPYETYLKIHDKFFKKTKKLTLENLDIVKKPVGLLPNKAKVDTWKSFFDEEDLLYYSKIIDSRV
ncbi:sulfotransferase domain-containing protein [Winogradskyella sp. PAMC22761]|nr:sulfotransferase domain-containing protein [Winogradskyella sp. PAMC22761]